MRGLIKVSKRYLLQVAARNLGLMLRKLFGMGTPRGLQLEGKDSSSTYLVYVVVCALWIARERLLTSWPSGDALGADAPRETAILALVA